jgi:hypothetical protein
MRRYSVAGPAYAALAHTCTVRIVRDTERRVPRVVDRVAVGDRSRRTVEVPHGEQRRGIEAAVGIAGLGLERQRFAVWLRRHDREPRGAAGADRRGVRARERARVESDAAVGCQVRVLERARGERAIAATVRIEADPAAPGKQHEPPEPHTPSYPTRRAHRRRWHRTGAARC